MTWKTWAVIFVLSSTFGLSFWPVPTTAALQTKLAAEWVSPLSSSWFVPAYTTASAIGFLLAGANSDLFGRRLFLLFGNVTCCVGFLVTATSKGPAQFTAGLAITGFGGGFCQMAMCSIPELMPNKFRHIGVCLSDGFVFVIVVIGPIVGRYAIDAGNWKYIYYGGFVAQFMSLTALFLFYKPPKHPKGIPWHEALPGLDYVGAFLVVPGICLTLVGIINTTYKKSTDILVIAPMCVGFGVLVLFGLWETFSNVKYPLCPPRIFRSHNGREFTVPFIIAFIVTMFYYGINVIYPTMINIFYITPTTSRSETLLLTLPGNLGLVFGALLLIAFGNLVGHWKWSLIASWSGMTLFGGLMALVTPYNKGTMIAFTFVMQTFFGWAQYESVAFTQLGVGQHDLGMSGGLAGVARYAGGSLAQAIYVSVLANTQSARAAVTVPAAAMRAGLDATAAQELLAALPLGAEAIMKVPGVNADIIAAASAAFKWSYAHGLKITALSSLAFGGLGLVMCLLVENIDAKMNNKTEIYLENDVYGERNEFH
ncbi:MFS general substrate transporter [Mytilinidion resinicola]|uniref:MFS general substrate transporter n=1 Tax=Mytilinidion resinicola TaxID=574789 RepID=A0A6A6Z3J9_9PEZI|nr:MFS general substrate transporter [Mytilinidion resinicola]KAF2815732.1 MFS general substrate transporter [Mytilinidion resinicola]